MSFTRFIYTPSMCALARHHIRATPIKDRRGFLVADIDTSDECIDIENPFLHKRDRALVREHKFESSMLYEMEEAFTDMIQTASKDKKARKRRRRKIRPPERTQVAPAKVDGDEAKPPESMQQQIKTLWFNCYDESIYFIR